MAKVDGRSQHETQVESWRQNVQMKLLRLITNQHCLSYSVILYCQYSYKYQNNPAFTIKCLCRMRWTTPSTTAKRSAPTTYPLQNEVKHPTCSKKSTTPLSTSLNGITILWFIQKAGPFFFGSLKIVGPTGDLHFQGNDEATFPQVDRHPRGVQNNEGCHDLMVSQGWYMLGLA